MAEGGGSRGNSRLQAGGNLQYDLNQRVNNLISAGQARNKMGGSYTRPDAIPPLLPTLGMGTDASREALVENLTGRGGNQTPTTFTQQTQKKLKDLEYRQKIFEEEIINRIKEI